MNYTREQAEQMFKDWKNSSYDNYDNFLDTKFPKLKNGMWVRSRRGSIIYITDVANAKAYGFDSSGKWKEESSPWNFRVYPQFWQPASDEEVIEALEKYAKSIGLFEGARVKCLRSGCVYTFNESYILKCGDLWCVDDEDNAWLVMQHGTWATPIKSDLHKKLEELKKQAEDEGMKLVITFENK
jgi:hypothetical protein